MEKTLVVDSILSWFYSETMEVQLTADQKALIRQAIDKGRLAGEEDAVREALSLWEERERSRIELIAALEEAEADLEAGYYTEYTDATLPDLAEELKREARALRDDRRSVK